MKRELEDLNDMFPRVMSDLKEAIENKDNQVVHSCYDEIIYSLAFRNCPDLVKALDKLVTDISFWYA